MTGLRYAIALAAAPVVAAPASPVAGPGLNHIYIVLDQASFDAIRRSAVVAQMLEPADAGLPDYSPPPAETDRIFLRGRTTYLELFAPNNRFGEPVGKVGVGLGEDQPGRFAALAARWRELCGDGFRLSTTNWTKSAPPVPWYVSAQCDDTASGPTLAVWAMVYRPEFSRWQAPGAAGSTDRRAILAPRATAGQGQFDVTGMIITVDFPRKSRIIRQLVAAGMVRDDSAGGTTLRGSGFTLTLRTGTRRDITVELDADRRMRSAIGLGNAHLALNASGLARPSIGAK